jgi:NAD(P)-dependent dehydrogenase (short-subunit alcohol dehydrogenase family)
VGPGKAVGTKRKHIREKQTFKEPIMKSFKGKVAVITGAASGIGRAIAERCIKEGMKIVLADVDKADLTKAEAELKAAGGTVISVKTDVAKRSDIERLSVKTLDAFGAVHLLVNNAGVGAGMSPWETTWKEWEWVVGVNLWGVIHGVKVFTPIMLAQNTECHIVNTASIAGLIAGYPSAPYLVTKHAVVALSEALYLELEQRKALLKASVLCPGFVKTNIVNAERARLEKELGEIPPQTRAFLDSMNAGLERGLLPAQVADQVFEAVREERFYIMTHPEMTPIVQLRVDNLLRGHNPIMPPPP